MAVRNADAATKFDSREQCQAWINSRVVRFKLKMVKAQIAGSPGEITFVPQKCDGKIVDTASDGFTASGTDEPLANYAAPELHNDKWVAVMKLR